MRGGRTWPRFGTAASKRRRRGAAALAALLGCAAASSAVAQPLLVPPPAQAPHVNVPIADFITEASRRFGIPEAWIAAVMRAESAFDPRATSPKGAMGLMQLMPDTWAALRARLGLGLDPYDPRDNILAGAGYLRDLYDAFGERGFLAAYNAGPGRYAAFLTGGRPLPQETRAYVAKVGDAIEGGAAVTPPVRRLDSVQAPRPGLFIAVASARAGSAPSGAPTPRAGPATAPFQPLQARSTSLFADIWGTKAR